MSDKRLDPDYLDELVSRGDYDDDGELLVGECTEAIKALRAELARVTAERDRWYTDTIHTCHDACPRIACVQRREIAALQAALRDATRSNT